jgi:hypothetical protein
MALSIVNEEDSQREKSSWCKERRGKGALIYPFPPLPAAAGLLLRVKRAKSPPSSTHFTENPNPTATYAIIETLSEQVR